jgi:hypothetical protein
MARVPKVAREKILLARDIDCYPIFSQPTYDGLESIMIIITTK